MNPPTSRFHRQWLDPDDWRFRSLLVFFAWVVGGLTWWAVDQDVVDVAVVPIPSRIIELLADPDDPDTPVDEDTDPAPRVAQPGRPGLGGGPMEQPIWSANPDQPSAFRDLFSHEVFGTYDPETDRWDAVFVETELTTPEGTALGPASLDLPPGLGGGGREDVVGSVSELERPSFDAVMVALVAPGPAHSVRGARLTAKLEAPAPEVSSKVVAKAARGWERHALACRSRAPHGWSGRVVVEVDVADGLPEKVRVTGVSVPSELATCLKSRARHLLRFEPTAKGLAKLPFVFE